MAEFPFQDAAVLPDFSDYSMQGRTYRFMRDEDGLYPFGFGLSYANILYGDLRLSAENLPSGEA